MELTQQIYRASSFRPGLRPSRTWSAGRVCDVPGCGTHLSIYNRITRCSVHEETRTYTVRGRRRPAERRR